jgi:hypothetical protein
LCPEDSAENMLLKKIEKKLTIAGAKIHENIQRRLSALFPVFFISFCPSPTQF